MTKSTKKVNESVKVENKTTNAKSILANLQKETSGLLKTNLGTKKASIYKSEIFSESTEKEKKSLRKKLRNTLYSLCFSLIDEKDETKKKKLISSFNEFYKQVYVTNDYSLQSVCNENLKTEKKDILQQALNICKK
jgi:hypothetical protein|nr:MAG TPA: hypothetical protein [Caudoviricetes sp.]